MLRMQCLQFVECRVHRCKAMTPLTRRVPLRQLCKTGVAILCLMRYNGCCLRFPKQLQRLHEDALRSERQHNVIDEQAHGSMGTIRCCVGRCRVRGVSGRYCVSEET
jgi:hypothetical protein